MEKLVLLGALAGVALVVAGVALVGNDSRAPAPGNVRPGLVEELSALANTGDVQAQHLLGLFYLDGKGIARNEQQGAQWVRRSAEQGYVLAQEHLGLLYRDGRGVDRSEVAARVWLGKAAEQGYASAQFHLASLLDEGTQRDETEARRWYERAVAQGHRAAHFRLANILKDPRSASSDPARALQLYKAIAIVDDTVLRDHEDILMIVQARASIASMYGEGHGVAADGAAAGDWRCKAFRLGRRLPEMPAFLASAARDCATAS